MIKLAVLFYLSGLFYLYATYVTHTSYPDIAYYFWEKSASAGSFVWLLLLLNVKKDRLFVLWALIVSLLRMTWQLIAFYAYVVDHVGIEPADDWRVATCFCGMLMAVGFLIFSNRNRITEFLSKVLFND